MNRFRPNEPSANAGYISLSQRKKPTLQRRHGGKLA